MVFKQHSDLLESLLDFILTELFTRYVFCVDQWQKEAMVEWSVLVKVTKVSLSQGREETRVSQNQPAPGTSLLPYTVAVEGMTFAAIPRERIGLWSGGEWSKITAFIWTSACLTTLYFQMCWILHMAFKQLHCCECSPQKIPVDEQGTRGEQFLFRAGDLMTVVKMPLFGHRTLQKLLR